MDLSSALTQRVMNTPKRKTPLIELSHVVQGGLKTWTAYKMLYDEQQKGNTDHDLLTLIAQLLYLPYPENLHHYLKLESNPPRLLDLRKVANLSREYVLRLAKEINDVHLLDYY